MITATTTGTSITTASPLDTTYQHSPYLKAKQTLDALVETRGSKILENDVACVRALKLVAGMFNKMLCTSEFQVLKPGMSKDVAILNGTVNQSNRSALFTDSSPNYELLLSPLYPCPIKPADLAKAILGESRHRLDDLKDRSSTIDTNETIHARLSILLAKNGVSLQSFSVSQLLKLNIWLKEVSMLCDLYPGMHCDLALTCTDGTQVSTAMRFHSSHDNRVLINFDGSSPTLFSIGINETQEIAQGKALQNYLLNPTLQEYKLINFLRNNNEGSFHTTYEYLQNEVADFFYTFIRPHGQEQPSDIFRAPAGHAITFLRGATYHDENVEIPLSTFCHAAPLPNGKPRITLTMDFHH